MAVAVIVFIVYITDVHQRQLNTSVHSHQKVEMMEPLDSKLPDPATISTDNNDAIERVGLVCCLTTMLFFAAPLSNLVSITTTTKYNLSKK